MDIKHIDTRHGTANSGSFSHGNCLPYTGVPWGMNYFTPSTAQSRGAWFFHPEDRTFEGFRLTHQPSPWMGDFSHFTLTPFSGFLGGNSLWHATSSYRADEAIFNPACLDITSLRYRIKSRLVPSMYGGILAMAFQNPSEKENGLLLTLPGQFQLKKIDEKTIEFFVINYADSEDKSLKFYVRLSFDFPISIDTAVEIHPDGEKNCSVSTDRTYTGTDGAIKIGFGSVAQQNVRFGTSFISFKQAHLNLERENHWSIETYLSHAEDAWNDLFSRIELTHHDHKQVSTFYHNLYRTFLFPQTFYEWNENHEKIHYDTTSKTVKSGPFYTNNGFWDTFRTVYPLYSLIAAEKYGDMLEGFLNAYHASGYLPKWLSPDERGLMPGTLIDAVIADAAIKGIRLDLMPEFLSAMTKAATTPSHDPKYGRTSPLKYLNLGYVPMDVHESVNHTLDYAFSDFCISRVAKVVSDQEKEKFYAKQALNYKNLFDQKTGFMRAKDQLGHFRADFLSTRWGRDYAEGSAWQTSWSVLHDFSGLVLLHGGAESFEKKLIELCNQRPDFNVEGYGFEIHEMSEMAALEFGQVAISNQPSFHYPYLFHYIGKPWMGTALLKNLMLETFNDGTKGYPGDEDNGTMAAWYVFSSLGFYPITAGSGEYVIGLPLWDKATLHLSSGNTLTIEAMPNQAQQLYVNAVKMDHVPVKESFLNHSQLMAGGVLHFDLGIVPNPNCFSKDKFPYALSQNSANLLH
ncbi:alpha-mannosidase [Lactococcus hircilactis]|uniref:Alpha-mannosidase n=1 Tax=Lactococcus hircilactis TaxID=1494462 RepID=A0A7X1Z8X1_9LACT|nr:GH92 family glycosyl hydrolase [Lactococcus hircilactis]MQW40010.1 alpha-mannosidase [Lactococcus hircilactis]